MEPDTKKNILKAIFLLRENFKSNTNPDSWGTNIQNACKHLEGREEWVHFYHYLSNPSNYNMGSIKMELGGDDVEMEEDFKFEGLDPRLEAVVYKNGNEATIHIKRKLNPKQDDEKIES